MMRKIVALTLIAAFIGSSLYLPPSQAGEMVMPLMPKPGAMVNLSPAYIPSHLQGITIHPDNALQFDFLIHKGAGGLDEVQKRTEYSKLVKYFLASLTIPDDNQWVNLSPYEHARIIKTDFGQTEMGRDLLSQDYLLKQITASLMYPESGLGKKFWATIYAKAQKEFGSTNIPVNTFNKVWITPDEAIVYESGNTALILKSHLKVMLEEDYLSLTKHTAISNVVVKPTHALASKIVKTIILPEIEREVNEGKNFAMLRQIYSGMVLATWYKKRLKESLLGQVYADKGKIVGVTVPNTGAQKLDVSFIYQKYLKAFRKGVFNYIKEDLDPITQETIPRKYFAGGFVRNDKAMSIVNDAYLKRYKVEKAAEIRTRAAAVAAALGQNDIEEAEVEIEGAPSIAPDQMPEARSDETQIKDLLQKLQNEFDDALSRNDAKKIMVILDQIGSNRSRLNQRVGQRDLDKEFEEALKAEDDLNPARMIVHLMELRDGLDKFLKLNTGRYEEKLKKDLNFSVGVNGSNQQAGYLSKNFKNEKPVQPRLITAQAVPQPAETPSVEQKPAERDLNALFGVDKINALMDSLNLRRWQWSFYEALNKKPRDFKTADDIVLRLWEFRKKIKEVVNDMSNVDKSIEDAAVMLDKIKRVEVADYLYSILGVSPSANEKELKSAFRKLSMQFHPDLNKNDLESKVRFQQVNGAYEILKDPFKRMAYDHDNDILRKGAEQKSKATVDAAMAPKLQKETPLGGIDMNSANLNLLIKRDGKGVPLPLSQQDMAQLSRVSGFVPDILEIKPVTNLPILSQLQQKLASA
jgi:hypothetical protein